MPESGDRQRWTDTIDAGDTPVVVLPAATPTAEARLAMAIVAELRARGVHRRDVVVTTRDIDRYEPALVRAALRHGIATSVWTQLPLADTDPYVLCRALCRVCAGGAVPVDELLRPLEAGWVPPSASRAGDWPVAPGVLRRVTHEAPATALTAAEWRDWAAEVATVDQRLETYGAWVATQPTSPSPAAAAAVLSEVLDRYNELVLPDIKARDDPALTDTVRTARAVVRMSAIVDRIDEKYADWRDTHRDESPWDTVGAICESFATQRPGRREHANATTVDIIEANNAWGREIPYVIAVGLTDGVWPQSSDSLLPVELQQGIRAGGNEAPLQRLAPRAAWGDLRDYDQFADVVAAATSGLILTYHTRTHDGVAQPRSPLLAAVDAKTVSQAAAAGLVQADRQLPAPLAALLPGQDGSTTTGGAR